MNYLEQARHFFDKTYHNYFRLNAIKKAYNNYYPNILILCMFKKFGGIETHCLSFYKKLHELNYNIKIMVPKNSIIEERLIKVGLPYYSFKEPFFLKKIKLQKKLEKIILKNNINIVHCNRPKDIKYLKRIKNKVKIILTRHISTFNKINYLKKYDAIICVNEKLLTKINTKWPHKPTLHLTPFFSEKKLLNFKNKIDKNTFFEKEFGIKLKNIPTIVQVGSLTNIKNHKVLLYAINEIINKKGIQMNVLLCGDGYNRAKLKKLATKLNIHNYVYFLGYTNKIAKIIYFSDIKTITSKKEGHAICLMEAALLKKVLIGPTKTGVVNTIKHKKTGLLFKNNDFKDLAIKIEMVLKDTNLQKKLKINAYNYVKNNFISDILEKKLKILHKCLFNKEIKYENRTTKNTL